MSDELTRPCSKCGRPFYVERVPFVRGGGGGHRVRDRLCPDCRGAIPEDQQDAVAALERPVGERLEEAGDPCE